MCGAREKVLFLITLTTKSGVRKTNLTVFSKEEYGNENELILPTLHANRPIYSEFGTYAVVRSNVMSLFKLERKMKCQ